MRSWRSPTISTRRCARPVLPIGVSVLCPGWVAHGDPRRAKRNWPGRNLGDEPSGPPLGADNRVWVTSGRVIDEGNAARRGSRGSRGPTRWRPNASGVPPTSRVRRPSRCAALARHCRRDQSSDRRAGGRVCRRRPRSPTRCSRRCKLPRGKPDHSRLIDLGSVGGARVRRSRRNGRRGPLARRLLVPLAERLTAGTRATRAAKARRGARGFRRGARSFDRRRPQRVETLRPGPTRVPHGTDPPPLDSARPATVWPLAAGRWSSGSNPSVTVDHAGWANDRPGRRPAPASASPKDGCRRPSATSRAEPARLRRNRSRPPSSVVLAVDVTRGLDVADRARQQDRGGRPRAVRARCGTARPQSTGHRRGTPAPSRNGMDRGRSRRCRFRRAVPPLAGSRRRARRSARTGRPRPVDRQKAVRQRPAGPARPAWPARSRGAGRERGGRRTVSTNVSR